MKCSNRRYSRLATAHLTTNVPKSVIADMNRTTKKNPPKHTQLKLLMTNYEEFEASEKLQSALSVLILKPDDQGHIYIGFPTHQTTGAAFQLAAHFIPTVERESIDFVDKTLAIWNQEILAISGLFVRIIFEEEVTMIQNFCESCLDHENLEYAHKKFAHTLNSFTFKKSTPSIIVGHIIHAFFFKSCSKAIRLISSDGSMISSNSIKLPNSEMVGFMKTTPVISKRLMELCPQMIQQLQDSKVITQMSVEDAIMELKSRKFNQIEIVAFLKWMIIVHKSGRLEQKDKLRIKNSLNFSNLNNEGYVSIDNITHFSSKSRFPNELALPRYVLPLEISADFTLIDLEKYFWGWKDLSVSSWLSFQINLPLFKTSPDYVEKVMQTINRHYNSLVDEEKVQVISSLEQSNCIVSTKGLKKPVECYFETVTLFNDLPKLSFRKKISHTFLVQLGVRETVDLQLFFDRLTDLSWDQVQLIKYLTGVQDKLTRAEWNQLAETPLFLSKGGESEKAEMFLASELYVPRESLKLLGLKLLEWKGRWKSGSDEEKFLDKLGLKHFIPLNEFFNIITSSENQKRILLIDYFAAQFDLFYQPYYNPLKCLTPFILTEDGELKIPMQVFSDPKIGVLGFKVINSKISRHSNVLGIRDKPPAEDIIEKIRLSPPTLDNATVIFEFLASIQNIFSRNHWSILKTLPFIPYKSSKSLNTVTYSTPSGVYLMDGSKDVLFGNIFEYVDFGTTANSFLRASGVKSHPSIHEITQHLISSPSNTLLTLGSTKYLSLLLQIASQVPNLQNNPSLFNQMKSSRFLIATNNHSEQKDSLNYVLSKPSEVYLIDDTVLGQLFKPLGAPADELLEQFYYQLGARWISACVKENFTYSGSPKITQDSKKLKELINDRYIVSLKLVHLYYFMMVYINAR